MDIFQVEQLRVKLHQELAETGSVSHKVFLIYKFYQILSDLPNAAADSYYQEFLGTFTDLLLKYIPLYKEPEATEKIICLLKNTGEKFGISTGLKEILQTLEQKLEVLNNLLCGGSAEYSGRRLTFPVLEKSHLNLKPNGYLETISIEIKKAHHENIFIIVPSEQEIEKRIEDQVKISWEVALGVLRKYYKRIHKYHKVVIYFENRLGEYTGNSLGTALALSFIEELFSFYNTNMQIKPEGEISITGSLNKDGSINPLSDDIISQKSKIIFFSPVQRFVVPEEDKTCAEEMIKELAQKYPDRKPEIIAVTDFRDLLNRRNIVSIEKKNVFKRAGKFAARYWILLSLLSINIVLFYFSGFLDFDDNPYRLENSGNFVKVLNKNGKVLWTKDLRHDLKDFGGEFYIFNQLLIDTDGDGDNEVILCPSGPADEEKIGTIYCYDKNKELRWRYTFQDSVSAPKEYIAPSFRCRMIGTAEVNKRKVLYIIATNYFATSAIFSLNLEKGTRTGTTLWHVGHIISGLIGDFNKDGKDEIVALAINNSLERSVIFSIDVDKVYGRGPSTKEWEYRGFPPAEFNKYILLPKTELLDFFKLRFNSSGILYYDRNSDEFYFHLFEDTDRKITINYNCSSNLEHIRPNVLDRLQVVRDSLVAKGIISGPYSQSAEYMNYLNSQIKYLQNKTEKQHGK